MNYLDVGELIRAYDLYGPSALDSVIDQNGSDYDEAEPVNENIVRLSKYEDARIKAVQLSREAERLAAECEKGNASRGQLKAAIEKAIMGHRRALELAGPLDKEELGKMHWSARHTHVGRSIVHFRALSGLKRLSDRFALGWIKGL